MLTQLGHLFDETPAQLRTACERAAALDCSAQATGASSRQGQIERGADDHIQAPAATGAADGGGTPEPASNGGHGTAAAEPAAAVAPAARPASDLNVVREGSIELDYGSDDGEHS